MGKFIVYGTILEEPKQVAVGTVEGINVLIEEKYRTAFKELINVFNVTFVGKNTACVPTDIKLAGAPAVIVGSVLARKFNEKYYYDLRGEQLSIITTKSFTKPNTINQNDVEDVRDTSVPNDNLPNDDLPF